MRRRRRRASNKRERQARRRARPSAPSAQHAGRSRARKPRPPATRPQDVPTAPPDRRAPPRKDRNPAPGRAGGAPPHAFPEAGARRTGVIVDCDAGDAPRRAGSTVASPTPVPLVAVAAFAVALALGAALREGRMHVASAWAAFGLLLVATGLGAAGWLFVVGATGRRVRTWATIGPPPARLALLAAALTLLAVALAGTEPCRAWVSGRLLLPPALMQALVLAPLLLTSGVAALAAGPALHARPATSAAAATVTIGVVLGGLLALSLPERSPHVGALIGAAICLVGAAVSALRDAPGAGPRPATAGAAGRMPRAAALASILTGCLLLWSAPPGAAPRALARTGLVDLLDAPVGEAAGPGVVRNDTHRVDLEWRRCELLVVAAARSRSALESRRLERCMRAIRRGGRLVIEFSEPPAARGIPDALPSGIEAHEVSWRGGHAIVVGRDVPEWIAMRAPAEAGVDVRPWKAGR